MELKDITTLEDTDHENFGRNYDFVGRVTPASHEAIEAFPTYIEGAIERFFKVAGFADNEKVVGQWAERFGLPDDLAVEMLDQATLIGEAPEGDNAGQAKKDLIDSLGKWARVRLLQPPPSDAPSRHRAASLRVSPAGNARLVTRWSCCRQHETERRLYLNFRKFLGDFDDVERAGLLVNCALSQASETHTQDKESPRPCLPAYPRSTPYCNACSQLSHTRRSRRTFRC